MARFRMVPLAVSLALLMASGAQAQNTAPGAGTASVADRAGIETTGEVIFQNIVIAPAFSVPVVNASQTSNVTVVSPGGDAVSLAVPGSFDLTREGGQETLTVLTTSDGGSATISGLESLISSGDVLSVDVGGAINVSAAELAPGEYRGLLVVVAQYN
jgi:hypothetical protein